MYVYVCVCVCVCAHVRERPFIPLSGEFKSVADDADRRLVMTGSVCLDKLVVETERLSESVKDANRHKHGNQLLQTRRPARLEWERGKEKKSISDNATYEGSSFILYPFQTKV